MMVCMQWDTGEPLEVQEGNHQAQAEPSEPSPPSARPLAPGEKPKWLQ